MTTTGGFAQAFAAAAHHFFPDGCPQLELQDVWPSRQDRNPVAAADALESIQQLLPQYVKQQQHGMTASEMEAVIVVALATLPVAKTTKTTTTTSVATHQSTSVGVGSPLVDGSSQHFRSLLRTLIPKRGDNNDDSSPDDVPNSTNTITKISINKRILDSLVSQRARLDAPGRCVLLQWITLMVRYHYCCCCCCNSENQNFCLAMNKHLRRYEPIWMQFALMPETCADAVRLLLHITTTATTTTMATFASVYRAQQVRACWDNATAQRKNSHIQKKFRPLITMLQLYARLDPDRCDRYRILPSTRDGGRTLSADEEWFSFPDPDWARVFENPRCEGNDENDVQRRPDKRARISSSSSAAAAAALDAFLMRLPQFLLPSSSSSSSSTSLGIQQAVSSVADIHAVRHAVLLSGYQPNVPAGSSRNSYHYWITQVRHNLPYILYEEWYESSSAGSSSSSSSGGHQSGKKLHQRALLQSLAFFFRHTGWLLPEMENFLLRHVLPLWSDDPIVLYDLIPALSPQRLNLGAFRSLIWQHLEPLFVYSSSNDSSLQYAIVAGALTGLLYRWGSDHPTIAATADDDSEQNRSNNNNNMKLLQKLIPWTDELLTKGFLLASSNHELLSAAAYEFYSAVARITNRRFLGAPDTALTYRMLLSSSAFSIDRICQLLVLYKKLFERLFQESTLEEDNDTFNERIDLFNSFVWDFGSVLWRCTPPPPPLSADMDDASGSNDSKSILFTDLFLRPTTQHRIHAAGAVVAPALSIWNRDVLVSYTMSDPSNGEKVEYLDYLKDECGLYGLHEFLHTFVGPLVQRRQEAMHE